MVSIPQALKAQSLGADRIEICSDLETGGLTPEFHLVENLCKQISINIRVMIRSTPIGFEADDETMKGMIDSIQQFKNLPIEGFAFGILKNNVVDQIQINKMVMAADPFAITFHKAIDLSVDLMNDLRWLNQFPQIDTILTSGGALKAIDGIEQLLNMKKVFNGNIMAAGKIIPEQLSFLHEKLGLDWYHGRSIVGDLGN